MEQNKQNKKMTSCVCAKCQKPWRKSNSPAVCPVCNQVSFAIAVPEESVAAMKKQWQDPEYRAKMRAARKKQGQDLGYQTRLSAAMKKLWKDPEYQAKMSAARKERWQDPEYRAKVSAAHSK